MSNFEQKPNRGALFKNNRKEPGSKQPDYTGSGNFDGKDFQVSAWLEKSKGGTPYFSFAFQPPYKKDAVKVAGDDDVPRGGGGSRGPAPKDFDDSDIPFVSNGGVF